MPTVVLSELDYDLLPPGFEPGGFDCEKRDLNNYLRDGTAHREAAANFSRTYVVHFKDYFVGYVSLLTDAIRLAGDERPDGIRYSTAPALKIGRLAVCKSVQFQGVGGAIVRYVVGKTQVEISQGFGCRYLTLDSHLDKVDWYTKRQFVRNAEQTLAQKAWLFFRRKRSMDKPLDTVSMRYDLFVPEVAGALGDHALGDGPLGG